MFWTDGVAAWHRTAAIEAETGADRRLQPASSSRLVTVNLESSFPDDSGTRLLSDEVFRARFSPRFLSTTLALAWVATGQQAGYITGGDLRGSVHWTAGIALCRAAGAVITNLAGDELHTGDHGLVAAADAETTPSCSTDFTQRTARRRSASVACGLLAVLGGRRDRRAGSPHDDLGRPPHAGAVAQGHDVAGGTGGEHPGAGALLELRSHAVLEVSHAPVQLLHAVLELEDPHDGGQSDAVRGHARHLAQLLDVP